jgi:hypothetical protein
MARAMVAGGMTPKQLAVAFGFTYGHVSRILQTPLFQAEVARLERGADEVAYDMREDLKEMALRSLEVIDEDLHLEPTDIRERYLRNKTAADVLDRIGLRKGEKLPGGVSLKNIQINVNNMDSGEIREQVMDLVKLSNEIEDD